MKLTNIRLIGRHLNKETGKKYNVHQGRKKGYGVDVLFFYRSGKRIVIADNDFYDNHTKIEMV